MLLHIFFAESTPGFIQDSAMVEDRNNGPVFAHDMGKECGYDITVGQFRQDIFCVVLVVGKECSDVGFKLNLKIHLLVRSKIPN